MLVFWEWMTPEDQIEKAIDFDFTRYMRDKESYGDHTFKISQANTQAKPNTEVEESPYYSTYLTQEGKRRIKLK